MKYWHRRTGKSKWNELRVYDVPPRLMKWFGEHPGEILTHGFENWMASPEKPEAVNEHYKR